MAARLRHSPDAGPVEGTPEFDAEMAKWGDVMGDLGSAGAMVAAHGLDTEATATRSASATTKESFFSYIIIDVADLDAALGWAKRMPNVTYGSVEVRPLSIHEQDS